jgi:hypothetical protein
VVGDPYRVLVHFQRQGARLGIEQWTASCTTYESIATFACEVSSSATDVRPGRAPAPGLWMTLQRNAADRDTRGQDVPPSSHLLLHFFDGGSDAQHRSTPGPKPSRPAGPPPPAFPTAWPHLLKPGDRIPPLVAGCCRQLVVEQGTAMVAPLAGFAICVTGGFNATFVVTGDVEKVVRGYARQFEAAQFTGGIERRVEDGASILDARYTSAGAGDLRATAMQRAGRPTYLELSYCND